MRRGKPPRPGQREQRSPDKREQRFSGKRDQRAEADKREPRPGAHPPAGRPGHAPRRDAGRNDQRDGRKTPAPPPSARAPQEPGTTWLYGRHAVLAALANPFREILRLVATADAGSRSQADIAQARTMRDSTAPSLETIDRPALDALLPRGAVHQGIAALAAPLPEPDLASVLPAEPAPALVVVLDQVTDPHNVGAIMRSAAAFGAHAVIVTERHAPEETGTLAKAASGALERVPLLRVTNLVRTLEELKHAGFWIAGLAGEADKTLAQAKLGGRIAVVLGAEGDGLRRLTREHCDLLVRLPMRGQMESLNVSNAAAVALYELARS
jgi:23S rRNA (guanosine2251-2'-O)-methyltransferase